jgi:hypothetical protein
MTAGSVIEGAFGLVRERFAAVAVWSLIYLAVTIASWFAMRPFFSPDAMTGAVSPGAMVGWMLLIQLAALIVFVVLITAAQRAVLHPAEEGLAYVRLGMDEVRMTLLTLFLLVVAYIGLILLGILGVVVTAGVAAALGATAMIPIGILLFLVLFGLFVWLQVRLSLAYPLTLLRRRIIIGESWRLTRGHFWSLFAAYLVVFIAILAMTVLVGMATMGSYFGALLSSGGDPGAVQAAMEAQLEAYRSVDLQVALGWLLGAVSGGLTVALSGGAAATAARQLVGEEESIAETFA